MVAYGFRGLVDSLPHTEVTPLSIESHMMTIFLIGVSLGRQGESKAYPLTAASVGTYCTLVVQWYQTNLCNMNTATFSALKLGSQVDFLEVVLGVDKIRR